METILSHPLLNSSTSLPPSSTTTTTTTTTASSSLSPSSIRASRSRVRFPLVLRHSSKPNRCTAAVISCSGIVEIKESEFESRVLKSERPVLVEFVATWCGPCRLISPAMQWLAQEYEDKLTVVKIDHDANPSLIEEYKVYGLPTLILFKDGKDVPESRREGAITKVKLKEYVDALLHSKSIA